MSSKLYALLISVLMLSMPYGYCAMSTVPSHYLSTDNLVDVSAVMNYTQLLDYLLSTPEMNQPNYIVCNGLGADLSTYTFHISESPVGGYHNLSDNYHNVSLSDSIWKGTQFYTPDDYNLKSAFITNSYDNVDIVNWAIFNQNVRNTQYWWEDPKFIGNPPVFPNVDIGNMSTDDKATILDKLAHINDWCDSMNNYSSTIEFRPFLVHNVYVANARGNYSGPYYNPEYKNIDNKGLEMLNMQAQTIKHSVKPISFVLESVILNISDVKLALKAVSQDIPSDFGLDEQMQSTIFNVENTRHLFLINKNNIDMVYNEADQVSWDVSAEKSYRSSVNNGQIVNNYQISNESN